MRDLLGALAVCIVGVLTLMGVCCAVGVSWLAEWREEP
jgi:hypothetical protein